MTKERSARLQAESEVDIQVTPAADMEPAAAQLARRFYKRDHFMDQVTAERAYFRVLAEWLQRGKAIARLSWKLGRLRSRHRKISEAYATTLYACDQKHNALAEAQATITALSQKVQTYGQHLPTCCLVTTTVVLGEPLRCDCGWAEHSDRRRRDAPPQGAKFSCLICGHLKPWAVWQAGVAVCKDCRDARYYASDSAIAAASGKKLFEADAALTVARAWITQLEQEKQELRQRLEVAAPSCVPSHVGPIRDTEPSR